MKNSQEILSSQNKLTDTLCQDIIGMFPGGTICCRMEDGSLIPEWISEKMSEFCGYSPEEFQTLLKEDFLNAVYQEDRERVMGTLQTQSCPDLYFRVLHKNDGFKWCHMNGVVKGTDPAMLYGFFMEMSDQEYLFQSISDETADEIYVIHRDTYELLYINHHYDAYKSSDYIGQACYKALYGKSEPCSFCTLKSHEHGGKYHDMPVKEKNLFFETKFHDIVWNGMPAYVKYIRDVTDEITARKEKERLEQYFQTVLQFLPGGVAVIRKRPDGSLIPEFISNGFAKMVGMTCDEAQNLYIKDALAGVHPEDREYVSRSMEHYFAEGKERYELSYRLQKGKDGYIWIKASFSVIQSEEEDARVCVSYYDITKEREAQEQMRRQYENMIFQHHRQFGKDTLVLGHCNVTKNRILEIDDYSDSNLLETFGHDREVFFRSVGNLIVDEKERELFLNTYLNKPSLEAFQRGDTERIQNCYIRLPNSPEGIYVQFKVLLVEAPDTGDVTGILTVTDITDQTIREKLVHQLTMESYDMVADVDLIHDRYHILVGNGFQDEPVGEQYYHKLEQMLWDKVLPNEKEDVIRRLDPQYILHRLKKEGSYSMSYSLMAEHGHINTKSLKVFAVDSRLGRICLARTDITESVREQQGLLNMIAYTFDMACFLDLDNEIMTVYTRDMVLKNLSPYVSTNYAGVIKVLEKYYDSEEASDLFDLEKMRQKLEEAPSGYDFILSHKEDGELCYKQINVLWGNETHRTICMVRADVTDMLAAEHRAKEALEEALEEAEEASRAKSDFLTSMSHDIRTPMNAIMGMTSLALAHLDESKRVEDYLQKISVSSKHLLSLINDILDMSQIEQSKVRLNETRISIAEQVEQLKTIMAPQAKNMGVVFSVHMDDISHPYFIGDGLRINQVLINILGNAFKFTKEGGSVDFCIEEIPAEQQGEWARYRFVIRDTGIGMSEDFQKHLFEPFVRSKETAKVEGTGLGLSITKGLIDLMKGTIHVESQLHQGTTFRIEVECKIAEEQAGQNLYGRAGVDNNENVLQGLHFLVVEDNAINSEILYELLEMHGATSTIKENGHMGVSEFQNTSPGTYDAILMDIQMPVMNGLEATVAIRNLERPDAKTIPIIAMTANAFAEDVQASLESGMNAHVAKPISIEALCDAVAKHVIGAKSDL